MEGINAKFVAAWNACENPELDSENPHFHNKYASLKATLKSVREACAGQGIAYMQRLRHAVTDEGVSFERFEMRSYVTDGSEELPLSTFPVECPPSPQSFGSNLTYAKRQQAQADWGITGEHDDDGEAAAGRRPQREPERRQNVQEPAGKRRKMLARCAELSAKCIENGMNTGATGGYMLAAFGARGMDELTDDQLVEFGKYLAKMEEQSRGLKERKQQ